ncbi:type IV secretion protein Rhs [Pantoea septica]|uniref:Type IV secretion protein Rhs n=2 Tax=Erwiniaceae TaxID=1903409 RepID=A0ABX3URJ1_9GAMM|nr:type IV secretion protein Rhs [Pantoea septica]
MWEGVPMLKRGGLRLLTSGEIRLATELYCHNIQYNRVWVHHGSYLPFGLQENNTAMTPNGEIWFETNVYRDDYSMASVDYQHLFMHEMMHVWQYQRGMNVRIRGLVSWAANYKYSLDKKKLSDYSMEQQASIASDYWLLMKPGFVKNKRMINYKDYDSSQPVKDLVAKYQGILKGFP